MVKKTICLFFAFCLTVSVAHSKEVFPFLGEITVSKVNVRAGGNVNFEQLCQLSKGDEVAVLEESYGWYKIKLPSKASGYISEKYIQPLSAGIGKVNARRVNIRALPSEKSSIIGQLKEGINVRIKENTAGWYKIEPVEDIFGWVSDKFVVFKDSQIPSAAIVAEPMKELPAAMVLEPVIEDKTPALFTVVGRVEDLGRIFSSKSFRYKLVVDRKTVYYLEGDKDLLSRAIHLTVKVEGTLKEDPRKESKYPVIIVSTINSLL